jgi:hypothetical protein
MGVAGAGEVLGRAAELHQHRGLGDHGAGVGADDVHPEDPVGRGVGEHFDEAVGGAMLTLARPLAVKGNLPAR